MITWIKELFGFYDKPASTGKGGSGTIVVNASAKAPTKAKTTKTTKAATKPTTKAKATKGKTGGSRAK